MFAAPDSSCVWSVMNGCINRLCRYKIGDAFVQLPLTEAQELLADSTQQIDAEVSSLEDKMSELRDELQGLKVALYARFGRSINLET